MNQIKIPCEAFTFFFKPSIRVIFDWGRMEREKWPIELMLIDDLDSISSWYMPWNFDENKKEVNYQLPNARPIQLQDVPCLLPEFDSKRRRLIHEFTKIFGKSSKPIQIAAPTYSLGNDTCFFLDGNHRMAALMIARIPFRLLAFTVYGPLDGKIVPEFRHWE